MTRDKGELKKIGSIFFYYLFCASEFFICLVREMFIFFLSRIWLVDGCLFCSGEVLFFVAIRWDPEDNSRTRTAENRGDVLLVVCF